jgi:hypothetical protein
MYHVYKNAALLRQSDKRRSLTTFIRRFIALLQTALAVLAGSFRRYDRLLRLGEREIRDPITDGKPSVRLVLLRLSRWGLLPALRVRSYHPTGHGLQFHREPFGL